MFKLAVLAGWFVLALAKPAADRTLVVADSNQPVADAEAIAADLRARGHAVTVSELKTAPALAAYGDRAYDNVVVVPGRTKGLGREYTSKRLLSFVAEGGNLLAVTSPESAPSALRETAGQLGIHVGARGTQLVDRFSAAAQKNASDDTFVELGRASFPVDAVVPFKDDFVVHDASAAYLQGNELTLGLVRAPATAYAYNALLDEGDGVVVPFASGGNAYVAAGFQARSNGRFAWIGAADLLASSYGADITAWVFQETPTTLRVAGTEHSLANGDKVPLYKVNNDVKYCVDVESWNGDAWAPYADATDLQLEFRMLDPYYRLNLAEEAPGHYCVEFKVPDQYGMFTFLFDYRRPGGSFLEAREVVTVRHNANDEWPRSWTITNSWVYLTGALSVIGAWVVFVVIYLGLPPVASDVDAVDTSASTKPAASKAEPKEPKTPVVAVVEKKPKSKSK